MEVLGKGSVTILDPAHIQTDAYEVKRHRPIMVSGVTLHSLPSGLPIRPSQAPRSWRRCARSAPPIASSPASGGDEPHAEAHPPHRRRGRRRHRPRARATPRAPCPAPRGGERMTPAAKATRPQPRREVAAARATPQAELRIVETRVYRGPNYWNYDPAIKLVVDLGVLEHFPTNTIPGFTEALLELLPGVGEHTCGTGKPGGFAGRLREGTWVGPRGRAHRPAAPARGRHRGRPRQDARHRRAGPLPRRLLVRRGGGRHRRRQAGRAPRQPPRRGRARLRLRAPSWRALILLAERRPSGRPRRRIVDEAARRDIPCDPPRRAGRWSSSGTASTRSGSGPR